MFDEFFHVDHLGLHVIILRSNFSSSINIKKTLWTSFNARSNRPKVFCKKEVLENYPKFTGKHLCQSLFFNKVAGLRPATLLKKKLWYRCFLMNFGKFSRTPFFIEHLQWPLLNVLESGFFLTLILEYFTQCKTFLPAKRYPVSRY